MTTQPTSVQTELKYVKWEKYDPDVMDSLLCDVGSFSKKDLGNLGRYKRGRKQGNNVEVVYSYGAGCEKYELGRLYAKGGQGIQSFPFDIRNPLIEKFYWDCDMENCHYNILSKLGEDWGVKTNSIQHYIQNRDAELAKVSSIRGIAKTAFLKVAYGGNIKLYNEYMNDEGIACDGDVSLLKKIEVEMKTIVDLCWTKYEKFHKLVKTKPNPKFSLFALILQTEERKCLLAMDEYAKTQGRSVDIFIHDGGEVRKLPEEKECPEELLRGFETAILEKTGYSMKVVSKPFIHSFQKPIERLLDSSILVNDAYAAEVFATLCGENIILDSGRVWVFDTATGIWSWEEAHIQRVVTSCKEKLVFKQPGLMGVKVFDYSGNVKNGRNLLVKLPDVLPKKDGFMRNRIMSDVGKLLFTDGIYDFKTATFTKGFDSNIVFQCSMPRPFPVKDQTLVDEIRRICFTEAFGDEGGRSVLLHSLMRAAMGDVSRKKYVTGLGYTNSGKGMLTQLCITAFGSYCVSFNGNSLLTRFQGGESAKELMWVMDIVNARFAFSSEIKVDEDGKKNVMIDGNMLKALTSGGDEMKARRNHKDEVVVVNKSTPFIFANDMPRINPVDDAIRERTQVVSWSHSYVDEPRRSYEKKKDPRLSGLFRETRYGDAFFWLMVEEYEKWRSDNFVEPKTPECVIQGRDELMPVVNIEDVLLEKYEITKNPLDYVVYNEICCWLKENGVVDSDNKIGRELTTLGLISKGKKVDRRNIQVRHGVRERRDSEE